MKKTFTQTISALPIKTILAVIFVYLVFFELIPLVRADQGALIPVETRESESGKDDHENRMESEFSEDFIATNEWKEIKEGQAIPAGLHIRINLQTGKKEAKLMENAKSEEENLKESTNKKLDRNDVAEALKHLKSDDVFDSAEQKKAEFTFKTIDKIKKDFEELKINFKTEYEILNELISSLKDPAITDADKIQLFMDLEYIVHKYDNAQDFVKLEGLQLVIPSLNSSTEEVRSAAASLLGSAMQSNPKVQIAALEHALLIRLVQLIIWDPSIDVQNHAMYALSCLVRQFPLAQQHLVDKGGLTAIAGLFRHNQHKSEISRLLLKAITLLSDLMEEQKHVKEHRDVNTSMYEEKLRQYNNVKLDYVVKNEGWCDLVPLLLASPDHDEREKVLRAMASLMHFCKQEFKRVESLLRQVVSEYSTLALAELSENDSDKYFSDLYSLSHNLLSNIQRGTKGEL